MKTSIAFVFLAFVGFTLVAGDSALKPARVRAEGKVITRPPAAKVVDTVIRFAATDGTPLEAKLTVPADANGPVPVVYHLHGAGARNYDNPIAQYRDADGQLRLYWYYDFYSHELAQRGLAFFRMNKRGCTIEPSGRLNLSSGYLREGWDSEPNYATLLKLKIPLAIFHGELDGSTRVEGVRETEAAFREAGKTNLAVHIYPGHDHDLNWSMQTSTNGGPKRFQDAFAFAADLVRQR